MYDLGEYANTIADLILAGLQDVTDRIVEKDLQPNMIASQLLKDDRTLVGNAGVTRNFPRKHDVDATTYSEGDDVPGPYVAGIAGSVVYEHFSCTPEEFGVSETITRAMIESADWNAINDLRDSLVDAMARKSDDRSWNGMLNAKTIVDEDVVAAAINWGTSTKAVPGSNNLAKDKVLEVLEVNDDGGGGVLVSGTDYHIDYFYGAIHLTGAPSGNVLVTYIYSDNTAASEADYDNLNYVDATTAEEFAYTDMVRAQFAIIGEKGIPDTFVLDNLAAQSLTLDDKFIDASGVADKTVMNGYLKNIGNMSVLMTTQLWPGVGICVQKKKIGYKVWKTPVASREELIQSKPGDRRLMTWEKSGVCIVHAELISVVLNSAPDGKHLT